MYIPCEQILGDEREFAKHILFGAAETADTYMNPVAEVMSLYQESSSSTMLIQLELEHTLLQIS